MVLIFRSCYKYSQLAILLLLMSKQMTFTKWRHYSHEKKTGTFIGFYATFADNNVLPFLPTCEMLQVFTILR